MTRVCAPGVCVPTTASEKPNGSIPADIAAESAQAPQPLNLMRYDAARAALVEANRFDEVKAIGDKRRCKNTRRAKDPDLIQMATDLRLRAERRAGEMLKEMAEKGERDPGGRGRIGSRPKTQLGDLGITWSQSSRWQKLAALPGPIFETHMIETRKRLARSLDKRSAPVPAKTPLRKKAAPATPDELPADVSALQVEIRQLRAALSRAQRQLVPHSPASLVAMLEHIYTKARDRTIWPPDPENWQRVRDFADKLQSVVNMAKALKL
jgi:hypothetical protein